MSGKLADYRLFWRQFRENFHTTGAVLPSGRRLARALCSFVPGEHGTRRILEVGPGTGAVTSELTRQLCDHDQLDLVELNPEFVERLRQRFNTEPDFQRVADRSRVLHQSVADLNGEPYDIIISGLPLNNFSVELVESLLGSLLGLLRPGGTLSFFQYVAVRSAKSLLARGSEKARLQGIGRALDQVLTPYEIRRDGVWLNVPPAWVHHVRVPEASVVGQVPGT